MPSLYPKVNESATVEEDNGTASQKQANITDKSAASAKKAAFDGNGEVETAGRKCHDLSFLLLFILFWAGMVYVAYLAGTTGDLNRLKYGNDSAGNLCGVINPGGRDNSRLPYQFIFNPLVSNTTRICVESCPVENARTICIYNYPSADSSAVAAGLSNGSCSLTYKTSSVLNRCLPDLQYILNLTASDQNSVMSVFADSQTTAIQIFGDIFDSWKIILLSSGVALIFAFVWLVFIQFFAKFIVWFTLLFVNLTGAAFTAIAWLNWWVTSGRNVDNPYLKQFISSSEYNQQTLLFISITASVIVGIVFLLTVALRTRISLAIGLVQETSKAVRAVPMVVFFPVFKYIFLTALMTFTVWIWAMLATSGQKVTSSISSSINAAGTFSPNTQYYMLSIYVALGLFWAANWIIAISQTTIAGAIGTWYWAKDKSKLPSLVVTRSFGRVLRYHLGSLAFGSLVIAIIQTFRAILMYIQQTLKKHNQQSKIAQYLLSCLQCCCFCLESFIKFINKRAYIEIALYGYSFCEASKTAFELLTRNALRVVMVNGMSGFLFFLGKLMISFAAGLVGMLLMQYPNILNDYSPNIGKYWSVSLLVIIVLAYLIASCFMSVLDMAVDTIFVSFCEDSERNDGSAEKPYHMSDSLKKYIETQSKAAVKL